MVQFSTNAAKYPGLTSPVDTLVESYKTYMVTKILGKIFFTNFQ